MRLWALVLVLALAGCYRGPAPAEAPGNKVAVPDRARAAEDVLAFLPIDSHMVLHVDLGRLRASPLWDRQIARLVTAIAGAELDKLQKLCGFDPMTAIDRVSFGLKSDDGNRVEGVIVGHSPFAERGLGCLAREGGKTGDVTMDGDIALVKHARDTMGVAVLGRSAAVAQNGPKVDRESLEGVMASGSPLRGSPAFLSIFERLEPGAAAWFVLNGNTPMFGSLAASGFKPRTIDGTISVGESYVFAARAKMTSADEADRLVKLLDGSAAQVRAMVEQFEPRADGDVVRVDIIVTEAQAQTIMSMLGAFVGP